VARLGRHVPELLMRALYLAVVIAAIAAAATLPAWACSNCS
jgi:hypothetical protein